MFIALVTLGTLQQTVSNPFLQVDQKGPTPFIAKRREMGREKGSASAALSKVLAELRVQPQSPESRLDALSTKLSFLLCSGFPSRCAHSQFPIHHNQFKTHRHSPGFYQDQEFLVFPRIPVNQGISCLPWAVPGADQGLGLEAVVEELCVLPRRRRCSGSCWEL